ncbi:hypothetical protein [Thioalkalivibrio sp.]|uniref:hypothetical protein n=1 Tax=Thioalkalivibrio sp. TaxID=2093813 RepID=UPI0035673BBB
MNAESRPASRHAPRLRLFIIAAIMAVALLVFLTVNATTPLFYEHTIEEFVEDREILEAVQSIGFHVGHPGPRLGNPPA